MIRNTLLFSVISLALTGCATPNKMNSLSVGMTKQEVISVMGQPDRTSATEGAEYMIYHFRNNGPAAVSTFGIIPFREGADYYVRLRDGRVNTYGQVGDFDSTKIPETKRTVDLNIRDANESREPAEAAVQSYNRGVILGQQDKFKEAAEAYRQAIAVSPDFVDAWCNLGMAYAQLGKYEEALTSFQEAIKLKPDLAQAYAGQAITYKSLGKDKEAAASLEHLRTLDPKLAEQVEDAFLKK
jgi:tetratricopeptide (TPR) repeat protein